LGAEETQIEASFCEAIKIAKEQKSVSLAKRAEGAYAEYRRQKASGSEGRGFRLAGASRCGSTREGQVRLSNSQLNGPAMQSKRSHRSDSATKRLKIV
jgi:hypothetical protein